MTTPAASWLSRAPRPVDVSPWASIRQIVYRDRVPSGATLHSPCPAHNPLPARRKWLPARTGRGRLQSMPDQSRRTALGTAIPTEPNVYQLMITLIGIQPPTWRRVLVPGALTLDRLHQVLQRVMGWTDTHLHEFIISGQRYGVPDPDRTASDVLPERMVRLRDVAPQTAGRFVYRYDFGDGWEHDVLVEKILPPEAHDRSPVGIGERGSARRKIVAGSAAMSSSWPRLGIRTTPSTTRCWTGRVDRSTLSNSTWMRSIEP